MCLTHDLFETSIFFLISILYARHSILKYGMQYRFNEPLFRFLCPSHLIARNEVISTAIRLNYDQGIDY